MTNFDADVLREFRAVHEVAIRTERHPKAAVVIWVVVADEEVFVRSVRGTKGRWYSDLAAGGPAEVPAEPLSAGDGTLRCPVDHAAARTALTSRL